MPVITGEGLGSLAGTNARAGEHWAPREDGEKGAARSRSPSARSACGRIGNAGREAPAGVLEGCLSLRLRRLGQECLNAPNERFRVFT